MKHTSSQLHQRVLKRVASKKSFYKVGLSAVGLVSIAMVAVFFVTRGVTPHTSELAFTEHSTLGKDAGSVIPASCNSNPPTDHFNGDCVPGIAMWIDQASIYPGEAFTMHWRTANAVRCDLYETYTNGQAVSNNIWPVTYFDFDVQWGAWSTTEYALNCVGAAGSFNQGRVTVHVTPRPATCGWTTPSNTPTIGNEKTYTVYANNVQHASAVYFPTWSDANGQDDIIWYPGQNIGGGTWKATINLASHPGYPDMANHSNYLINTHIYMNGSDDGVVNRWCGTANFIRPSPSLGLDFVKKVDSAVYTETSKPTIIKAAAITTKGKTRTVNAKAKPEDVLENKEIPKAEDIKYRIIDSLPITQPTNQNSIFNGNNIYEDISNYFGGYFSGGNQ
jgi:hypothetical protein